MPSGWKFPSGFNTRKINKPSWSFPVQKADNPFDKKSAGPMIVQGRTAGSLNEYNVAIALGMLKLTFEYQVPIMGGRNFRGGSVIDFMVHTVPIPTPVWVQGDYWHGSAAKREADQYTMRHVREAFRYQVADSVEVWGHETMTPADALAALKRVLKI